MEAVVLKVGRYDPTLNGTLSKYVGYVGSTKQAIDLPLVVETCADLRSKVSQYKLFDILAHSTLLRGVQTAQCIDANLKIAHSSLNEVKFDLARLLTEEEFLSQGSTLVRARFVNAFIEDSLLESRFKLSSRINSILKFLNEQKSDRICLISHSFIMKMLEATVLGTDIWKFPGRLADFIKPDQKTYKFGEGFTFVL